MKTSIIVDLKNSILNDTQDILRAIVDELTSLCVNVNRIVMSSSFDEDFAKFAYDDSDFLLTINGTSNIKTMKKVFKLSTDEGELQSAMNDVRNYVNALNKIRRERLILKTFGISKNDIQKCLQTMSFDDAIISVVGDSLDLKVIIEYDKNLDYNIRQDIISTIYGKIRSYVYTDENISLYDLLLDLLAVNNKTLSVVEIATQGNIIKCLNTAKNCNQNILLGITSDNVFGLTKTLNLSEEQVFAAQQNPVEIVYEMAAGILELAGSDLTIATYSDIDSEFTYIAVGDMDGIHVYKNLCTGTKSQKIDTLSKSAVYYLIKKIKQNDLFFDQIVV